MPWPLRSSTNGTHSHRTDVNEIFYRNCCKTKPKLTTTCCPKHQNTTGICSHLSYHCLQQQTKSLQTYCLLMSLPWRTVLCICEVSYNPSRCALCTPLTCFPKPRLAHKVPKPAEYAPRHARPEAPRVLLWSVPQCMFSPTYRSLTRCGKRQISRTTPDPEQNGTARLGTAMKKQRM